MCQLLTILILTLCSCLVKGLFHHRGTNFELLMRKYDNIEPSEHVTEQWMEQPVDHFSNTDNRTWKMRYFQNFEHFKPYGPIFLYIGGEAPLREQAIAAGLIYDLAKETNGALFASEHRYYGKSIPLCPNEIENLKYLSSQQALADVRKLLIYKKQYSKLQNSKIVVVGGSYAGNLATWMKKLYPNLVDAAIASSAPLLAKYDFEEYLETVGDDFKKYGSPSCYRNIEKQFKHYDDAFRTEQGIEQLKKEENVCSDVNLNLTENQFLFVMHRGWSLIEMAQYGNVSSFKTYCNKTNQIVKENKCVYLNFTEHPRPRNNDMWDWQVCTEFAYHQTTSSDKQPFGKSLTIEVYAKICMLAFGIDENSIKNSVDRSNNFYGALHPNVSNVVFVNGELDPWHRLGILEDISEKEPAIFIPKTSHCADLLPALHDDPQELTAARLKIKKIIKKWIDFKS